MNLATIYRILLFAWQGFWRNFWLSLVTISIIVLTFISINILIIINIITDTSIEIIKEKVDISLYFKPEVGESQALEVETYLASLTQVKDTKYISQAEAMENFIQRHRQDEDIIDSLKELEKNPLGATIRVKAKTIEDYPSLLEEINTSPYIDLIADKDFNDNNVYIARIKNFSDNIKRIALFTSLGFILVASLIVFNTIRVAIYTHREEIGVMKLVGATNWFIRSPFVVEGVFYGIFACILSIIIVYPMLNFLQPYVNNFFLTEEFSLIGYFRENFWQIFGLELLVIILINMISSNIAIRRYLNV